MTWVYQQSTGELSDSTGKVVGVGYAGGNCGRNPEGVNNPDMQCDKGIGPLPVGFYNPATVIDPHPQLGAFAIPLIPEPQNEMHGRGGFYMHGDKAGAAHSASEGCIIMGPLVRHAYYNSKDRRLKVIA